MLVTNDPWLCAGHLFDIALVTPVFSNGRLVALMGTVGHVSDIGGSEGLDARPRAVRRGRADPADEALRGRQARTRTLLRMLPERAQSRAGAGRHPVDIAANAIGGQRLLAFMAEYGLEDLAALAAVVHGRSEAAMRAAIRAVPDGVYESRVSTARPARSSCCASR